MKTLRSQSTAWRTPRSAERFYHGVHHTGNPVWPAWLRMMPDAANILYKFMFSRISSGLAFYIFYYLASRSGQWTCCCNSNLPLIVLISTKKPAVVNSHNCFLSQKENPERPFVRRASGPSDWGGKGWRGLVCCRSYARHHHRYRADTHLPDQQRTVQ